MRFGLVTAWSTVINLAVAGLYTPSVKCLIEMHQGSFPDSPTKGGSGDCSLFHIKRFFFPLLYLEGTQNEEGRKCLASKSDNGSTSSSFSLGQRDAVNVHNVYV